jgi:hypothetical protein
MLRKICILSVSVPTIWGARAFATDWSYTSQGSQATEITGGYGAVANPSTGSVYNDGKGDYSYAVILDSGSSGFLMSETVTDEFDVPLQPGQTYTETGIGGSEVENVTEPLSAYYAPISDSDPDNTSTMTAYGTYTFESRQNDPLEGYVYFGHGSKSEPNKELVSEHAGRFDGGNHFAADGPGIAQPGALSRANYLDEFCQWHSGSQRGA